MPISSAHRATPSRAFAGLVLLAVAAPACSGHRAIGQGDAVNATPALTTGQVVEVESLDSLIGAAADQAGPIVADTEIHYAEGDSELTIGGLTLEHPMFPDMFVVDLEASNPHTGTWRSVLLDHLVMGGFRNRVELEARAEAEGDVYIPADEERYPMLGLGVFAQTTLVTDPTSRAELFSAGFWHLELELHEDGRQFDVVHRSETTHDDGTVTCWVEARRQIGPGYQAQQSIVLFAGADLASSGIILRGSASNQDYVTVAGDFVESVCGRRPEGL